ncbi:protein NUCLEAR FUSION DEFECTIVE 4 isoform X2 [Quercus suber]|uniref:protein NUCLEAR FUSION DEFECTIVE 4 isoform X2 n=1 Tax=Quercus suber TaxID=58331 RepID=UPI0032DE8B86
MINLFHCGTCLFQVFFLCLLAGCSICWFNTVCFVLCNQNFPANRPLAISLTVSFNGVSAALYALAANAIDPSSDALYLLLNALIPLLTSVVSVIPILRQPSLDPLPPDAVRHDSLIFLLLNFLAVVTDDLELHKELLSRHASSIGPIGNGSLTHLLSDNGSMIAITRQKTGEIEGCCQGMLVRDQLAMLGQEHLAGVLVRRFDFWLYYLAYFCGGTIGLVYSNNLGQIAQSLGQSSNTTTLLTLYSSFSFFGRLLSAVPDYIRAKFYFARTGWLTIALLPTPIALFLLASSDTAVILHVGTALVGLSSGFIFAAAVSITSELFGPNSVGVNHNILITNIPVGSLVYGYLAALVYDANISPGLGNVLMSDSAVCMGRQCYFLTFLLWGCMSVLGLVCSMLLFFRTRHAYDLFEQNRISTQLY